MESAKRILRRAAPGLLIVPMLALGARAGEESGPIVVSPAQEVAWGERARAAYLSAHPLSGDEALAARADQVGRRVSRVSDRPDLGFRFLVVRDDAPQASSIPGGTVCLTEGLMRLYASDDELAFTIGHELAHIVLRHHASQLRMQEALRPGLSEESALLAAVGSRFDRQQEFEADRYGALYAVRAGFRYSASHDALTRLAAMDDRQDEDSAHPDFLVRIGSLERFRVELERALEAFREGALALGEGRSEEAVPLFELFVWAFPQSVEGRLNLGAAHLAVLRDAAGPPHGLAEAFPILPDPGIRLRGTADPAELERARLHFEQALRTRPGDPLALAGLALVHVRESEPERAREQLVQALAVDPESPALLLGRGNVEFVAGDAESAVTWYRKAITSRPGWVDASNNLAIALEQAGRPEEASAVWSDLVTDERYGSEAKRRVAALSSRRPPG